MDDIEQEGGHFSEIHFPLEHYDEDKQQAK